MRLVQDSRLSLAIILAVSLALTSHARATETQSASAQQPPPVILISIDTLRADHLSCYGYSRLKTPHIDGLARGGTIFTEISSQAPITLPSHTSLFTSTYPFANGVRENGQAVRPDAITLASVLAAHGYKTAAFIGGFSLARRFGLANGFQTYDSPFDQRIINGALDLKRPAPQVLDAAEHWLQVNSAGSFMLFVHLFDLHEPYDAPTAYRARAPQSEYDQALAYVDDSLGGFFEFLARSRIDRRALIVLFSDHGESLGDHGENTHGYFVYRSTLHVPLIFHWPRPAGSEDSRAISASASNALPAHFFPRVEAPAGLIDVAPTVLNYLGLPAPSSFCGHSLLELATGGSLPPSDVYSESFYARDKFGWAGLMSLRRGDYQYIAAPRPELYDLKSDPDERDNLATKQAALAASYREGLQQVMARYRTRPVGSGQSSTDTVSSADGLRTLGYLEITTQHAALDNSGIDPKDRVFEYRRYLLAGHLARTGKASEAAEIFQSILNDDPRNLPAAVELARIDGALHRYVDGENRLKTALAINPHNVEAEELLGDTWLAVGDHNRAEAEFHHLLTFAPQDYEAHFGLGLLASNQGQLAQAAEQFRAALAANPQSAEAHYQLGLTQEAQNQRPEAIREFQSALQIDPQYHQARRELTKLAAGR